MYRKPLFLQLLLSAGRFSLQSIWKIRSKLLMLNGRFIAYLEKKPFPINAAG
jgi:hypothetical protein